MKIGFRGHVGSTLDVSHYFACMGEFSKTPGEIWFLKGNCRRLIINPNWTINIMLAKVYEVIKQMIFRN